MAICEAELGHFPNVVKAFFPRPAKLRTFVVKYNEMMLSDESGLSRLEREMIPVVVSCADLFIAMAHRQALRGFTDDPILGVILMVDYQEANLTPRQRVILEHACETTSALREIGVADRDALRQGRSVSGRDLRRQRCDRLFQLANGRQ